ncbi:FAD-dependent monooxygenase asL4 [Cladobotryum mycophilum]|uniref:FAD-dependent monooxygenase asL4 n=1 Tax=Cladobotryum mycophilum TaxID=491253 RepID=A0ABR0SG29_9HYPO
MSSLRVLISGAGIAGPAMAFWLTRLGHSCTVLERFPTLRTDGQQVDLRNHGLAVIDRMGLRDEITRHNIDEVGFQLVNAKGERQILMSRQEEGDGRARTFTSELEIMRGDLSKIFYDVTEGKAEYRFGVTVEDYENEGDGVRVKLSDGTEERFDLLVAADGQSSRIRQKMMQVDEEIMDNSIMLQLFAAYFKVPRRPDDENLASGCHVPGRRLMVTRWHTEDAGQAYLVTRAGRELLNEALKKDVEAQKAAFAEVFDGAGWQAARLIEAMNKANDFYAEEVVQRKSSRWYSGRVVLLGDTAYAPGALTGMGTTLAVVGAYILAGELAKHGNDISAGLAAFDKTLRPFVEESQVLPPGVWGVMWPNTAFGVKMLHTVAWIAVLLRLDKVAAWLDAGSAWKLPEYKDLSEAVEGYKE